MALKRFQQLQQIMSSDNLTLYVTTVFYNHKLASLFYSYATCQMLCAYLHLNFRSISEKKNIFPVTDMNRQGEIIWLVIVALSVAHLLCICLAGSAALLVATLVSLTPASSDAA